MATASPLLQALLVSLAQARQGTQLVLDSKSLGGTSGAALLQLFSDQLQLTSVTLDAVVLPAQVTGLVLPISGTSGGVAISITFQDALGEIAIQALFQAPALAQLQTLLPALASDFFSGIAITGATASVTVPGLSAALAFTSPTYGVIGLVSPNSGLITTTIAPRVDGQVAPPSGAKGLFVELGTVVTGFRIGPLTGGWSFPDFGWLMGLSVLGAFPSIIPTTNLGLSTFDLNLYPTSPGFSSLSLDVADITHPTQPLWSAMGGKIQLTDVIVILDLAYSDTEVLSLANTGSVQGNFVLGTIALDVSIPFPLTGVWALTAYPDLTLPNLDDIATLLDNSGQLASLLPAQLAELPSFELSYLRIAVDASAFKLVEFTFAVGSTSTWKLVPNVLELESLQIQMTVDGTPAVSGSVVGTIGIGSDSELIVRFGRNSALQPWRLDAISPAIALPSLGDLAQLAQGIDLASQVQAGGLDALHFVMTNVNFGMTIDPPKLTNLGLTLQLANGTKSIDTNLDWVLIDNVLTLTEFEFGFQLAWGDKTSSTKVFGSFVLNDLEFDITFAEQAKQAGKTDALIAEYSAQGGAGTVDIKHLISLISPSVAAGVPDGLVVDLSDALLAYIGNGATKKYVFAMDLSLEMPLSDLPLVGKALPDDAKVGLKKLKVVVASAPLTPDDVSFINGLSKVPVLPLPPANTTGNAIPQGFSMIAELELGSLSVLMTSPPVDQPSAPASSMALLAATPKTDPVMWIDVQKTFGPVAIQKVGFSYQAGGLYVVSNLSLAVGGLEIDLIGIGVGSPIQNPSPTFTIQGLAVSFVEGPISVMGGMIGTISPEIDFTGALSVRAPELALAAFAGYATYQDHPSFFLYGVLDVPIGGPPPFFVTGVAAGMGFNRKLVIPSVAGVSTFPLVAWATGNGAPAMDPTQPIKGQVETALALLAKSGVVAPSVGDYWFAAGIRFKSFEIIDSFALVTVSLGTDVEIALLGLSTLTLPPEDPDPVAEIQIALEVSFSFATGLLAVAGQLTNNSYVLSPDCRLTGGFAFYLWFSGEHAGETVLTLGGYNPNFTVPSYYPVVPRLGLSWKIGGELAITGGLYFALTSNVVMAGGKLSAVWQSGPIRAWFTYWADFLMTFAPFHYYIDGGIDLGASFTVHLVFFSVSMTIHIGVAIELWGPSFAGKATVDLSIISFTISFGDQSSNNNTVIAWPDFVNQLLPAQPAGGTTAAVRRGRPLLAADDPPPPPAAVVQINVTNGLLRTLPAIAGNPVYLVSGETFQCAVLTVIPTKTVEFSTTNLAYAPDAQQPLDKDGTPIQPNTAFGAGPSNLSPKQFQPALTLGLASETPSILHAVRRLTNAPKALWENKTFDSNGVPAVNPSDGLTQSTITDALVGLTLIPYTSDVDYTRSVPLESLLFTLDDKETFAWSPGVPPTTDPFTDQTVAGTITAPAVSTVRGALLGALAAQGVTVTTTIDVSSLANPANDDLQAAPRLRLLGEQAAA